MATLLRQNGGVEHVTPANGMTFTLEEMQSLVGGFVQAIPYSKGFMLTKRRSLPQESFIDSDEINGDAVIVTRKEMGDLVYRWCLN